MSAPCSKVRRMTALPSRASLRMSVSCESWMSCRLRGMTTVSFSWRAQDDQDDGDHRHGDGPVEKSA